MYRPVCLEKSQAADKQIDKRDESLERVVLPQSPGRLNRFDGCMPCTQYLQTDSSNVAE